jgi:uncharacterized membrane protein (Fun14 family)
MSDDGTEEVVVVRRRPGLVRGQPLWKKLLLTVSLLVTLGGGVLWGLSAMEAKTQPTTAPSNGDWSRVPVGRSFLPSTAEISTAAAEQIEDWRAQWGPGLVRFGISFAVGFMAGFAFRQFLKTLAILLAVGVVALIGLSLTNVINIDLSEASTKYEGTLSWLGEQATRVKDTVISRVPATVAGVLGFVVGFLRR